MSGDVTGIDSTLGSNEVNKTDYSVDAATGLVTGRTDATGTTGNGYQADGALTTVIPPSGSTQPTETYGYDNFGDRTNGPAATDTSSFQAGGQITADTTNSYTWDADGNQVGSTVTATGVHTGYHYNTDHHQLTSVDLPDGSNGQRVPVEVVSSITCAGCVGLVPVVVVGSVTVVPTRLFVAL